MAEYDVHRRWECLSGQVRGPRLGAANHEFQSGFVTAIKAAEKDGATLPKYGKQPGVELRIACSQGVHFNRYPPMEQSDLGVWSAPGGTKIAWFLDPDENVLSWSEHPEE